MRSYTVEAPKRLGVLDVQFAGWADQKLDTLPILDITQWIEAILDGFRPQVIFTHHRGDINRDHRIVHEATLTAARPYSTPYVKRILCYETPSATEWAGPYTEDCFTPNVYVDITQHLDSKFERSIGLRDGDAFFSASSLVGGHPHTCCLLGQHDWRARRRALRA